MVLALFGITILALSGLNLAFASTTPVVPPTGIEQVDFFDALIDENEDGLAESLQISMDIYGAEEEYFLEADLYGPNSELIATASDYFLLEYDAYYNTGYIQLPVQFPGSEISASGVDGPYTVAINIETVSLFTLDYSDNYITANYNASDFEEAVIYDEAFFDQIRLAVFEDELQTYGVLEDWESFEDVLQSFIGPIPAPTQLSSMMQIALAMAVDLAQNRLSPGDELDKLIFRLEAFSEIEITHTNSETGHMYSSIDGYIGNAELVENYEEEESFVPLNQEFALPQIGIFAEPQDYNATPEMIPMEYDYKQIYGGTTGAFERRQLKLNGEGFDKITSNMLLPFIYNVQHNVEVPYVYYGFDYFSGNTSLRIEGGMEYQTGSDHWNPYIKYNTLIASAPRKPYYSGDTLNDFNFLLKKTNASDTYYTAYLYIGTLELRTLGTNFTTTQMNTMTVKRNNTIARTGFNGTNIVCESYFQKWNKVQVRKFGSTQYQPWSYYPEQTFLTDGLYDGTVDCIDIYVQRGWGFFEYPSTSIFYSPIFPKIGDVNGDGWVTPEDAMLVLQYCVSLITLTPRQQFRGDVNGDGIVSSEDAAIILRMVVGGEFSGEPEELDELINSLIEELLEELQYGSSSTEELINWVDESIEQFLNARR